MEEDDTAMATVSMNLETKVTRVLGGLVSPANLKITIEIIPDGDVFSIEMTTALVRVRHWIESDLNGVIAMSADNREAFEMFFQEDGEMRCVNQIMLTPGMPTDDILACLFAAKVQAMIDDYAGVVGCKVASDNALKLSFNFLGDPLEVLPTMEEWIGPRSYFKEPWWNRSDSTTFDLVPPADADLTVTPSWSKQVLPHLDLSGDDVEDELPAPAVLRPNFKPVVIDGGKNPDE